MSEQNKKKEQVMEPNANITDAARQFVRGNPLDEGQVYDLIDFRGMGVVVVVEGKPHDIQPIQFFTEGNRRYAVGPKLKGK